MKVEELNREQLKELKINYLSLNKNNISYEEIANIENIIPDAEILEYYNGVNFTEADFFNNGEAELIEEQENNFEAILAGSKEIEIEGSILTITSYNNGDKIQLDLSYLIENKEALKGMIKAAIEARKNKYN